MEVGDIVRLSEIYFEEQDVLHERDWRRARFLVVTVLDDTTRVKRRPFRPGAKNDWVYGEFARRYLEPAEGTIGNPLGLPDCGHYLSGRAVHGGEHSGGLHKCISGEHPPIQLHECECGLQWAYRDREGSE